MKEQLQQTQFQSLEQQLTDEVTYSNGQWQCIDTDTKHHTQATGKQKVKEKNGKKQEPKIRTKGKDRQGGSKIQKQLKQQQHYILMVSLKQNTLQASHLSSFSTSTTVSCVRNTNNTFQLKRRARQ